MDHDTLTAVAAALRNSRRVAALTGAGVSAESGLPTFRGAGDSLWSRWQPEMLATPEAFARDPALVWGWYQWRRALVARARPNAGHYALAELERRIPEFTLITQNVDGLHAVAGSRNLVTLHGDLMTDRCSGCGEERPCSLQPELADAPALRIQPPPCPRCGALLRPAVVWFGESLPAQALEQAAAAARACELFLVIGTSATVYPAASLAPLALQAGAAVAVVNPAQSHFPLHIAAASASALPLLLSLSYPGG